MNNIEVLVKLCKEYDETLKKKYDIEEILNEHKYISVYSPIRNNIKLSKEEETTLTRSFNVKLNYLESEIKALSPRREGFWEYNDEKKRHYCNVCFDYAVIDIKGDEFLGNFCHNCGAKLKLVPEEE